MPIETKTYFSRILAALISLAIIIGGAIYFLGTGDTDISDIILSDTPALSPSNVAVPTEPPNVASPTAPPPGISSPFQ